MLIDGQDISRVTQESLRRSIAVVAQDISLFHRSVLENLRYGRPEATDEEVYRATEAAQCTEFIKRLPQGFATIVGERGLKLSGGQRQRIAIARAFLSDAPIILLDEATSALDTESEQSIQEALMRLVKGRTVIAVAHRLSTLDSFDRIIVLEWGQIVEDGSSAELLERKRHLQPDVSPPAIGRDASVIRRGAARGGRCAPVARSMLRCCLRRRSPADGRVPSGPADRRPPARSVPRRSQRRRRNSRRQSSRRRRSRTDRRRGRRSKPRQASPSRSGRRGHGAAIDAPERSRRPSRGRRPSDSGGHRHRQHGWIAIDRQALDSRPDGPARRCRRLVGGVGGVGSRKNAMRLAGSCTLVDAADGRAPPSSTSAARLGRAEVQAGATSTTSSLRDRSSRADRRQAHRRTAVGAQPAATSPATPPPASQRAIAPPRRATGRAGPDAGK